MRLIAVVMGEENSNTRNSEVSALLDYGYNLFKKETYITTDEVIDRVEVEKGNNRYADIVVKNEVSSVNKKGYKVGELTYDLSLEKIVAPIYKGDVVGTLIVKEDGKVINTVDVTVLESNDKAGFFKIYFRYLMDIISGNITI